jgi:excisionase family DNA binding protein
MKIDPATIAAVITAFAEIPVRVAGMERAVTELTAKVEALRAASPPLLVPIQEAATIFKVSVPTMRRWVKTGQVPVVRVANTVRVDLSRLHGVDAPDIARMAREARGLG